MRPHVEDLYIAAAGRLIGSSLTTVVRVMLIVITVRVSGSSCNYDDDVTGCLCRDIKPQTQVLQLPPSTVCDMYLPHESIH